MDEKITNLVAEGYQVGYANPDLEPGAPLAEPWATYYRQGFEAGREARRQADQDYPGPSIGVDPGGQRLDDYNRRWNELFEAIYHQHMPHTEIEMEIPEPPPMNVIR